MRCLFCILHIPLNVINVCLRLRTVKLYTNTVGECFAFFCCCFIYRIDTFMSKILCSIERHLFKSIELKISILQTLRLINDYVSSFVRLFVCFIQCVCCVYVCGNVFLCLCAFYDDCDVYGCVPFATISDIDIAFHSFPHPFTLLIESKSNGIQQKINCMRCEINESTKKCSLIIDGSVNGKSVSTTRAISIYVYVSAGVYVFWHACNYTHSSASYFMSIAIVDAMNARTQNYKISLK